MVLSKSSKAKANADFVKKKQKIGKTKLTSNSQTNTSFTAKKVNVRISEQLAPSAGSSNLPRSHRNLSLAQLMSRTDHHSDKVRRTSFLGIHQLLSSFPELITGPVGAPTASVLLSRLCAALVDTEHNVRSSVRAVLKLILNGDQVMLPRKVTVLLGHIQPALTYPLQEIREDAVLSLNEVLRRYSRANRTYSLSYNIPMVKHSLTFLSKFIADRSDSAFQKTKSGIVVQTLNALTMLLQLIQPMQVQHYTEYSLQNPKSLGFFGYDSSNKLSAVELMEDYNEESLDDLVQLKQLSESDSADSELSVFAIITQSLLQLTAVCNSTYFDDDLSVPLQQPSDDVFRNLIMAWITLFSLAKSLNIQNQQLLHSRESLYLIIVNGLSRDTVKSYAADFIKLGLELFSFSYLPSDSFPSFFLHCIRSLKEELYALCRARKPDNNGRCLDLCTRLFRLLSDKQDKFPDDFQEISTSLHRYFLLDEISASHRVTAFHVVHLYNMSPSLIDKPNEHQQKWVISLVDFSLELNTLLRNSDHIATTKEKNTLSAIFKIFQRFLGQRCHLNEFVCSTIEKQLVQKVFKWSGTGCTLGLFDIEHQSLLIDLVADFNDIEKDALRNLIISILRSGNCLISLAIRRRLLWNVLHSLMRPVLNQGDLEKIHPQMFSLYISAILSIGVSENTDSKLIDTLCAFSGLLPNSFLQQLPKLIFPKLATLSKESSKTVSQKLYVLEFGVRISVLFRKDEHLENFGLLLLRNQTQYGEFEGRIRTIQQEFVNQHGWSILSWFKHLRKNKMNISDMETVSLVLQWMWEDSGELVSQVVNERELLEGVVRDGMDVVSGGLGERLRSQYMVLTGKVLQ